jgi:hypothetical protein
MPHKPSKILEVKPPRPKKPAAKKPRKKKAKADVKS